MGKHFREAMCMRYGNNNHQKSGRIVVICPIIVFLNVDVVVLYKVLGLLVGGSPNCVNHVPVLGNTCQIRQLLIILQVLIQSCFVLELLPS
jgi:hypothetical protein